MPSTRSKKSHNLKNRFTSSKNILNEVSYNYSIFSHGTLDNFSYYLRKPKKPDPINKFIWNYTLYHTSMLDDEIVDDTTDSESDAEEQASPYIESLINQWLESLVKSNYLSAKEWLQRGRTSQTNQRIQSHIETKTISGHEILEEFTEYALQIIHKADVAFISYDIKDWTSMDDPNWQHLILELTVKADPELAMTLWDNLSQELRTFIKNRLGKEDPQLLHLLSIKVNWQ